MTVTALEQQLAANRSYARAMDAAAARFRPLTDQLTKDLGLDAEPEVQQTGGMVMCLGIYWPDGAYVWISDYWWEAESFILGLYKGTDDDEGVYPEPPAELLALLVDHDGPPRLNEQGIATAISEWATPIIAAHGAEHGWERR